MRFSLTIFYFFSFITYAFGVIFKKSLPNPKSQRCIPIFSFELYLFIFFIFTSMIHFELIFVHDMKSGTKFILLHVDIQLTQHRLLKQILGSHCIVLKTLSKINWLQCKNLFLYSWFYFIDLHVYPVPVSYVLINVDV